MQELGAQLTGAARSIAENLTQFTGRGTVRRADGPDGVSARSSCSTLWVSPMRAMLEEQQELIDAVASWAEEQRKLADRFSELAARHREMTEQVLSAITPALDHVEWMAGRDPVVVEAEEEVEEELTPARTMEANLAALTEQHAELDTLLRRLDEAGWQRAHAVRWVDRR